MSSPAQVACDSPASGINVDVMIATLDPATGAVSVGPVLMNYSDCSDCRPVTAYGAGMFWIYDNSTTSGAQVLEVSATTGKLVAAIPMPSLIRTWLAANDAGLYIADFQGGQAPGEAPPDPLYRIPPGASSPVTVIATRGCSPAG